MPKVLSPRDLVSRPDSMDETTHDAVKIVASCALIVDMIVRLEFRLVNSVTWQSAMCVVQFRLCCQVWILGPLDLTH